MASPPGSNRMGMPNLVLRGLANYQHQKKAPLRRGVIAIRIAPPKEGLGTRIKTIGVTHVVWPSALLGVLASKAVSGVIGVAIRVAHASAALAAVVVSVVIAFNEGFFQLRRPADGCRCYASRQAGPMPSRFER